MVAVVNIAFVATLSLEHFYRVIETRPAQLEGKIDTTGRDPLQKQVNAVRLAVIANKTAVNYAI